MAAGTRAPVRAAGLGAARAPRCTGRGTAAREPLSPPLLTGCSTGAARALPTQPGWQRGSVFAGWGGRRCRRGGGGNGGKGEDGEEGEDGGKGSASEVALGFQQVPRSRGQRDRGATSPGAAVPVQPPGAAAPAAESAEERGQRGPRAR